MQKAMRLTTVIIVSMIIPIVPFLIVGELPGARWLSQNDENSVLFGLVGGGLLTLDILLPVPSSLIGTALGARLGVASGFVWCWLGLMAGNGIGFALGHLFPRRFATHLPTVPTEVVLFLSRPVPVFAEAATLTAGANRLGMREFFLPCGLGNAIYAAALCTSAALWLPGEWGGPALVVPMVLPALAWVSWRMLTRSPEKGS